MMPTKKDEIEYAALYHLNTLSKEEAGKYRIYSYDSRSHFFITPLGLLEVTWNKDHWMKIWHGAPVAWRELEVQFSNEE